MIFLTIGTQLPFDRLVRAVDRWAARRGRDDVYAQVGRSSYEPTAMRWTRYLEPEAFQRRFERAELIVAHAGMGTIISAMELGKPVLVMPRRAAMGEHRNDHQLATAKQFADRAGVYVAEDEADVPGQLDRIGHSGSGFSVGAGASPELLETIRTFLADAGPAGPLSSNRSKAVGVAGR
ncbi:MAG: glycosyltransferase [Phycisphaeraceae bacterium]